MAGERKKGFEPVCDENSRVLILGSFPSVMSRKNEFYYGNPQNRFWKMISAYFKTTMPRTNEEKKKFLLDRRIALWDVVLSCEITGSADDAIRESETADLSELLKKTNIELILLNGKKAFTIFEERYKNCGIDYKLMPSTSPANPRYNPRIWEEALDVVFGTC